MNILIIGADSFVGKNFCAQLDNIRDNKARWYKLPEQIDNVCCIGGKEHLNAVELMHNNWDVVFYLTPLDNSWDECSAIESFSSLCGELHRELKPAFVYCGHSLEKEAAILQAVKSKLSDDNWSIVIYNCPEIFGKWHEHSALDSVSSLCYRFANNISVDDFCPDAPIDITYIDNVVDDLLGLLSSDYPKGIRSVCASRVFHTNRKNIYDLLQSMDSEREQLKVPRVSDEFIKAVYSTYLSYLSDARVSYPLKMNIDARGSFTEFLKTNNHGQISVNISKPGIVKGQHWHNNRVEKFLVVSGSGLLQQRRIGVDENGNQYPILDTYVSGEKMEVVEVRPGFTHNLINLSQTNDLVTIIWGNDCFDPNHPDTYSEIV